MADKVPLDEQIREMERVIGELTLYHMTTRGGLTIQEADVRAKRQAGILATLKWLEREQAKAKRK